MGKELNETIREEIRKKDMRKGIVILALGIAGVIFGMYTNRDGTYRMKKFLPLEINRSYTIEERVSTIQKEIESSSFNKEYLSYLQQEKDILKAEYNNLVAQEKIIKGREKYRKDSLLSDVGIATGILSTVLVPFGAVYVGTSRKKKKWDC